MYIRESRESILKKALIKVFSPSHTRTFAILAFLLLAAIIPLTVTVSQKQQETRQEASGCSVQSDYFTGSCASIGEQDCKIRSASCGLNYKCENSTAPGDNHYRCNAGCTNNSQCPTGQMCDLSIGSPGNCRIVGGFVYPQCTNNGQCKTEEICDLSNGSPGLCRLINTGNPPPDQPGNPNPNNPAPNTTCTETSKSPYRQCGGALCGAQGVVGTSNDSVKVIEKDCSGTLNYTCSVEQACTNGCDPATGLCKSTQASDCKDNPADPPFGYKWKALCERNCKYNTDCPLGADQHLGWCYGFPNSGLKCLQLEKLDSGTGGAGLSCTLALDTSRSDNVTNNKILATVTANGLLPSGANIDCSINGQKWITNPASSNYCDIKGLAPNTNYTLSAKYTSGTTKIGECTNTISVTTLSSPGTNTGSLSCTLALDTSRSDHVTYNKILATVKPNGNIPNGTNLECFINGKIWRTNIASANYCDIKGLQPSTNYLLSARYMNGTTQIGKCTNALTVITDKFSIQKASSSSSPTLTPTATPSPTPKESQTVTKTSVVFPNGGENWSIGKVYGIKWNYNSDASPNEPIPTSISLKKVNGSIETKILTIAEKNAFTTPGTNIYYWIIPKQIETGSYKIEVFVHSQSFSWESDISDNTFSITASTDTSFEGIRLTSPIGGELIRAGDVFPIKWEYKSSTALKDGIPTVILLQKYDGRFTDVLTIANVKTLEGENTFNWTVPMLETGMNYRLLIKLNKTQTSLNFIFKKAFAQTSESAGSFGNFAILGTSKTTGSTSPTPKGTTGSTSRSTKKCTDTDFGCIPNDPIGFVSKFYGIGLGFVGGVALLFIIFGGYLILSSQGNAEQLDRGKAYIIYSILGLLLAIFGFALMEIIAGVFKIPGL